MLWKSFITPFKISGLECYSTWVPGFIPLFGNLLRIFQFCNWKIIISTLTSDFWYLLADSSSWSHECCTNVNLDTLLNKPASLLIKYAHDDTITHFPNLSWFSIIKAFLWSFSCALIYLTYASSDVRDVCCSLRLLLVLNQTTKFDKLICYLIQGWDFIS